MKTFSGKGTIRIINSLRPYVPYVRKWTRSALNQIMPWHRTGAKPLSESMFDIVNWTLKNKPKWNINRKRKCIWKCRQENSVHFVLAPVCLAIWCNSLLWRHNGHDSVSNHQPHDCVLNLLFRRRSKETSKLRLTGLCVGNSPMTGEFPAQMASYAENVSIWWRYHVFISQN